MHKPISLLTLETVWPPVNLKERVLRGDAAVCLTVNGSGWGGTEDRCSKGKMLLIAQPGGLGQLRKPLVTETKKKHILPGGKEENGIISLFITNRVHRKILLYYFVHFSCRNSSEPTKFANINRLQSAIKLDLYEWGSAEFAELLKSFHSFCKRYNLAASISYHK